jgi:hypothetical protein
MILKQLGRKERLERVGVAWNREGGATGPRSSATTVYLYPSTGQKDEAQ